MRGVGRRLAWILAAAAPTLASCRGVRAPGYARASAADDDSFAPLHAEAPAGAHPNAPLADAGTPPWELASFAPAPTRSHAAAPPALDARARLEAVAGAPQSGPETRPPSAPASAPASAANEPPADRWETDLSAYWFAVPHDVDFAVLMAMADRGALHLEARYQYEELDTVSLWGGFNFGAGEALRFDATAMGGIVAGESQGFAPGYRATLSYGAFDLYTEGEYVVSIEHRSDDYFYSWSELGCAPAEWIRFGLASQRTKVVEVNGVVEPGLFVELHFERARLSAHVFSPDHEDRYLILSLGFSF